MSYAPDMGDGGGYLSTDWSQWRVDQMAPVINGEQPAQVSAHSDSWFKVFLAAATLYERVSDRRKKLADRWRGDAANAYFAKFDEMLAALGTTRDAAYSNYMSLRDMADTITKAQQDMAPILAKWEKYDREEADYKDDWVVIRVVEGNPVSKEEREALNEQARTVMNHASGGLFDSYQGMTPPPQYTFTLIRDVEGPDPDGGSSNSNPLESPAVQPLPPQRPSPILGQTVSGESGNDLPILDGTPVLPGLADIPNQPVTTPSDSNPGKVIVAPVIGKLSPTGPGVPRNFGSSPLRNAVRPEWSGQQWPREPGGVGRHLGPTASIIGAGAGSPARQPRTPAAGQRVGPVGGILRGVAGQGIRTDSHKGQRKRGSASEFQDPFSTDAADATPSVLQPDAEPDFRDPGPALGAR